MNRRVVVPLGVLAVLTAVWTVELRAQGFEGRIFTSTPETVAIYEFNGPPEQPDGVPLPNGSIVPDLSGNGLDATVESNGTDLSYGPGDPAFDVVPGVNREMRRVGNANGAARLSINDDQDAFEMAPEDDFSLELYINRETTNDPVKWGLLAGTWHSRSLIDDTQDPNVSGAWYGYGLIRADEAQTAGQWSFVLNPVIGGVNGAPRIGCCNENHAFFNIDIGRHYVVLSVNRIEQSAVTYVDGVEIARQFLQEDWSFTTPDGYEHARFTMFAGEDDPSRQSFRQAPAGAHIDALRVQRKALAPEEVQEIYQNILDGVPSPEPVNAIRAFVSAGRTTVITGQCVKLDGSGSFAGEGKTIVKYEWKVADDPFETGDKTREVSFDTANSQPGYTVTLRITNNTGETSEARINIKVQRPVLVGRITALLGTRVLSGSEIDIPRGTILTLDGTASAYDIPIDALRCPLADFQQVVPGAVTEYSWDLDNKPLTIEDTRPFFETAPFNTAGEFKISLLVRGSDGALAQRTNLIIRVADPQGNNRIFHSTPDTVAHYEFNDLGDIPAGTAIPDGTMIRDLSGNGLDATVEGNDSGELIVEAGVPSLDVPPGSNLEVRRIGNTDFNVRIGVNDDGEAFEMPPEQDFSIEVYIDREQTDDALKWGILAGTWHSRNLIDDLQDPETQGAWYGYGLIRSDETATGGQWSWVLNPLEGGIGSPPRIGCCTEHHAFFNIPLGRHYVVLSVNRTTQTADTYVDGNRLVGQILQPDWSFTTPDGYEHARFTMFAGEDDPSRDSYRPAPAGANLDALRFQLRALTAEEIAENWTNIRSGVGANPEFGPTPPQAPTGLTATAGDGQITLDWNDNTEANLQGYFLLRSEAGGAFTRLNPQLLTESQHVDSGLTNGIEYCYQVVAENPEGSSAPSQTECARPGVLGTRFIRGDVDGNGAIEISDPIRLLGFLFLGEVLEGTNPPTIECVDAGDFDNSGVADISDAIASLGFQFLGEAEPPAPYPNCGFDPDPQETPDLGCVQPPATCQ